MHCHHEDGKRPRDLLAPDGTSWGTASTSFSAGGVDPLLPLVVLGAARDDNAGFTLIEILVVLVLLGILTAVSVAALPSLSRSDRPAVPARLSEARRAAIASGREVTISIPDPDTGAPRVWRFLPDGRGVGPGIDQRNGSVTDTLLAAEPAS